MAVRNWLQLAFLAVGLMILFVLWDVVLPTEDGRELRLRCIVRPDAAQAALLDRLGLDLPQRLRVPPPVARTAQM
jgi:hypothetical protein